MSSPSPIPPPNDRRNSRASSSAGLTDGGSGPDQAAAEGGFIVGGPPNTPSPIALRASNSPSCMMRRRSRAARVKPDMHLLDYVTEPDNNLVCPICHCAFDQPVRLACEHYFCRDCLDHAWEAQPRALKSCPTCRDNVDPDQEPLQVPKIIETMLDELQVLCPNTKLGCDWVNQRSNLLDHVMKYCEYAQVECPSFDCRLTISQKDFHKGCLHYNVNCEHCLTLMLKKDLEEHQRTTCPNRTMSCPNCAAELLRLDYKSHTNTVCPKAVVKCQGTLVGCTHTAEREVVLEHQKTCPMATMAPHFREQQARLERTEARIEPLARKVGILEDGLTNITNMLYPANSNAPSFPSASDPSYNDEPPEAFPLMPTPDFRLPPASFPPVPPSSDQSQTPFNNPAQPPFDSQIHHLLTLHENLRDEVSRITAAMNEHEGRTSMMIMNESQRVRDDMMNANAAINTMRAQLHWLVSATLRQQSANSAGSSTARAGGSTSSGSGSGTRTTQGASSAMGSGTRPGAGGATFLQVPPRRLSDSTRQVTKL